MVEKLKLRSINLNNIEKLNVEATLPEKGYGRRFRLTMDGLEKEVVFKNIFKKARKLSNDASDDQLYAINRFIDKLKTAQEDGDTLYKNTTSYYKFVSWFHRFFGGAYLGNHLDRIEKLQGNLKSKSLKVFERFFVNNSQYFTLLPKFNIGFYTISFENNQLKIQPPFAIPTTIEYKNSLFTYQHLDQISEMMVLLFEGIEKEIQTQISFIPVNLKMKDHFIDEYNLFKQRYPEHLSLNFTINGEQCKIKELQDKLVIEYSNSNLVIGKKYVSIDGKELDFLPSYWISILNQFKVKIKEIHQKIQDEQFAKIIDDYDLTRMSESEFLFDKQDTFFNATNVLINCLKTRAVILTFNNTEMKIWVNRGELNFQEQIHKGSLTGLLQISNGKIKFEGNSLENIPQKYKGLFIALVSCVYKEQSTYENNEIYLFRESLKYFPEWSLNQFINFLKNNYNVRYLEVHHNSIEEESASDAGGLKREFVANLFSALCDRESLFRVIDGSLKIPCIQRLENDQDFNCNEIEAVTYRNLGKFFSYCYYSKTTPNSNYERNLVTTGRLVTDALFKAVFSITREELLISLRHQPEVQIRMAKNILIYLDKPEISEISNLVKIFNLIEDVELVNAEDKTLYEAVLRMGETGEKYQNDEGEPDFDKIRNKKEEFNKDLLNCCCHLLKDPTLVESFNGIPLASMLDPIYHIAQGMSSSISWSDINPSEFGEYSNKIQGSVNRDEIINSLQSGSGTAIDQKVLWLKDWIKNDATENEIKLFLKFATGGTAIPKDRKISIGITYDENPYITSSTCKMKLNICNQMNYSDWGAEQWDNTKEKFIRNLKGAMEQEGFQVM